MSRYALSTSEEAQVHKTWLHRGQIVVAFYLSIICIAGVLYLGAMLARGEYVALVIGAILTAAGCLSGAVAWGALALAQTVLTQGEQLVAQRERIALLEAEIQFRDEPINAIPLLREADPPRDTTPAVATSSVPAEAPAPEEAPEVASEEVPPCDAGPGVADPTQADQRELAETLSRISDALTEPTDSSAAPVPVVEPEIPEDVSASPQVDSRGDHLESPAVSHATLPVEPDDQSAEARFLDAVAADDLEAARQALQELNGAFSPPRRAELEVAYSDLRARVAERLRLEFGALLRAENYREAIHKGDEIVQLLPDSRMCSDFEVIRPHLESRAGGL